MLWVRSQVHYCCFGRNGELNKRLSGRFPRGGLLVLWPLVHHERYLQSRSCHGRCLPPASVTSNPDRRNNGMSMLTLLSRLRVRPSGSHGLGDAKGSRGLCPRDLCRGTSLPPPPWYSICDVRACSCSSAALVRSFEADLNSWRISFGRMHKLTNCVIQGDPLRPGIYPKTTLSEISFVPISQKSERIKTRRDHFSEEHMIAPTVECNNFLVTDTINTLMKFKIKIKLNQYNVQRVT